NPFAVDVGGTLADHSCDDDVVASRKAFKLPLAQGVGCGPQVGLIQIELLRGFEHTEHVSRSWGEFPDDIRDSRYFHGRIWSRLNQRTISSEQNGACARWGGHGWACRRIGVDQRGRVEQHVTYVCPCHLRP